MDLGRKAVGKTTELPAWMQAYLTKQSIEYIGEFHYQFQELSRVSYDARLWAAAGLMMKFCSDDKFADFRAWLIVKGQRIFENAIRDPDTLAEIEVDGDHGRPILFDMNYVAETAYRVKVGKMADITDLVPKSPKLILHNQDAWDGDQDKLPFMFPRLFARFGA